MHINVTQFQGCYLTCFPDMFLLIFQRGRKRLRMIPKQKKIWRILLAQSATMTRESVSMTSCHRIMPSGNHSSPLIQSVQHIMGLGLWRATVSCPPLCIWSIWNDSGNPGPRSAGGTLRPLEFQVCSHGDGDSEVDTVGQGNPCFNIGEAGANCFKIQYVMLYHSSSQQAPYFVLVLPNQSCPILLLVLPVCCPTLFDLFSGVTLAAWSLQLFQWLIW